jgi:hypothetical protein
MHNTSIVYRQLGLESFSSDFAFDFMLDQPHASQILFNKSVDAVELQITRAGSFFIEG